MLHRVLLITWIITLCSSIQLYAQSHPLEDLINRYLDTYDFDAPNRFRLGVYMEMKGQITPDGKGVILDFDRLGKLRMYPQNCLLQTEDFKVYHLNPDYNSPVQRTAFNEKLHQIFEGITLMSNSNAEPRLLAFVDRELARKNLGPFEKIYLRHILLNFGHYDQEKGVISFRTDQNSTTEENDHPSSAPDIRLQIKLDRKILRGYYLTNGGTVYVENVDHSVRFATGESYDHNVMAFKLFLQKLFVQSVQFVVQNESSRKQQGVLVAEEKTSGFDVSPGYSGPYRLTLDMQHVPEDGSGPIYHHFNWIPMMLGILRNEGINIGDSDIIPYFIDEPYFSRIYAQLLPDEKTKVDRFQQRRPR